MNIVVITADKLIPGETDIINAMFAAGLHRLHVRKPELNPAQTRDFINNINAEHYPKLVVHRHHGLYAEIGLGGLHLSAMDRENPDIVVLAHSVPHSAVSTSLHAWEELTTLPFTCSYVFISPVFNSISKPGYNAAIELGKLRQLRDRAAQEGISLPGVFGLGGVTKDNIGTLKQEGFDGAAVLGSVWQSQEPVEELRKIMAAAAQEH